MKKLFLAVAMTAMIAPSVARAADINQSLENICTMVKDNSIAELRDKVRTVQKDFNVRLGDYYTGVTCSGMSLIRYAAANKAQESGEFMVKKMRSNDLKATESDGNTLEQWLVNNGHADTVIHKALKERS